MAKVENLNLFIDTLAQLIEKGTTTLQFHFGNLVNMEVIAAYHNGDLCRASFKRQYHAILLHYTNRQPSLSLIEKVAFFF
jgi:hypothetical protein